MKKNLAFRWLHRSVAVLLISSLSLSVGHADDDAKASEESKEAVAVRGTPKIDGEIDDVWEGAPELAVSKLVQSETTISRDKMATATVKLLWDDEHIYALWIVKDPKLSDSSFQEHEQDSIEFFIDELNAKAGSYKAHDAQYRVSYKGTLSGGDSSNTENVNAIAKVIDDGYLVEMSVKLNHLKPEAGKKVGIELQVNDDPGTGSRGAVAKWHHPENDSYLSTSNFGTVTLKDKAE